MARHDVVVVGGGNAGISLAARLRRIGARDVAVVAPDRPHLFRPLLNYVAGGQATMGELTRSAASVLPEGCTWIRERAVAVHADERELELAGGGRVGYGDLVLAPGLEDHLDAVPGLSAAMAARWSLTAHLETQAPDLWAAVTGLSRGRVVFTLPTEPSPCGGTALKPLLLACDHWARTGVLRDLDVHLVTPWSDVLDLPFVDHRLGQHLRGLGVTVHHEAQVASVDHEERTVTLTSIAGSAGSAGSAESAERAGSAGSAGTPGTMDSAGRGDGVGVADAASSTDRVETVLADVDRAFVVPPYRGPGWLAPLARPGASGQVDVDPETLAHRSAPRVWSLGDVAALDTRPSGGALRRQVEVLADNIARNRLGEPLRRYDGYTIIPITVDRRRLLLAEFDRTGRQAPTTGLVDLTVPRRALWLFDRYIEPLLYFRALLKGRLVP